jgi:outer membrane lipoprotein
MKQLIRLGSFLILTGPLLFACTSIPEQFEGEYLSLTPKNTTENNLNTPIRWGGVVLETRPENDYTCFEILARQLEKTMRPKKSDQAEGRFIACKSGFYDPEVFKKGREVTLTGKVVHIDISKVGEFDYHFPVVDIEFMTLWPKRRYRPNYGFYGPYRPYYWHYPHYGFRYRYPYW